MCFDVYDQCTMTAYKRKRDVGDENIWQRVVYKDLGMEGPNSACRPKPNEVILLGDELKVMSASGPRRGQNVSDTFSNGARQTRYA